MSNLNSNTGNSDPAFSSAFQELPPYLLECYREQIAAAKQKLDLLGRFTQAEVERPAENRDPKAVDWNVERTKKAKMLDQWLRETDGAIRELMKLRRDIRDDRAILNEYVLERSGRTPK